MCSRVLSKKIKEKANWHLCFKPESASVALEKYHSEQSHGEIPYSATYVSVPCFYFYGSYPLPVACNVKDVVKNGITPMTYDHHTESACFRFQRNAKMLNSIERSSLPSHTIDTGWRQNVHSSIICSLVASMVAVVCLTDKNGSYTHHGDWSNRSQNCHLPSKDS